MTPTDRRDLSPLPFRRRRLLGLCRHHAPSVRASAHGNDYTWVPVWFRLERVGDVVIASHSSDGATWFEVGRETVPMSGTVYLGPAVCSRNPAETYTALFDHITLAR